MLANTHPVVFEMTDRLTADSPRFDVAAEAPVTRTPYLHQEAAVFAMRRLEDSAADPIQVDADSRITTAMGVYADKPGAGKSFTVLAHIIARPVLTRDAVTESRYHLMSGGVEMIKTARATAVLDSNLIVVPRGIHGQWVSYLSDMTGYPPERAFTKTQCKEEDLADILGGRFGIVIITENVYRKLSGCSQHAEVTFQRFVLDEADSVNIPAYVAPKAAFTWYVTATPTRLFSCPSTAKLRARFMYAGQIAPFITVRSTASFIDAALRLPAFTEETITVVRPRIHGVIRGLIPRDVMAAITACDIESAIAQLGCAASSSEDSIVFVITRVMKESVEGLEASLESAPDTTVPVILDKIRRANDNIRNMASRIRETDCCPISLDTIRVKAVTPCCNNAFEFGNLIKALDRNRRSECPLCKAVIRPADIFVVKEGAPDVSEGSSRPKPFTSKMEALHTVLERIKAARGRRGKVLIFSDYSLNGLTDTCDLLDLRWREVKGSAGAVRNTVAQFTEGGVDVLLLNANHFAAGLNLQAATDIITLHRLSPEKYTQLVGRAQRPVRTEALAVHNIAYDGADDDA